MKAIEIQARKHFKNVKAGELKPVFSPGLAPSESNLVWVGDVPLPLEVYYNYLAARDRKDLSSAKQAACQIATSRHPRSRVRMSGLAPLATSPARIQSLGLWRRRGLPRYRSRPLAAAPIDCTT